MITYMLGSMLEVVYVPNEFPGELAKIRVIHKCCTTHHISKIQRARKKRFDRRIDRSCNFLIRGASRSSSSELCIK